MPEKTDEPWYVVDARQRFLDDPTLGAAVYPQVSGVNGGLVIHNLNRPLVPVKKKWWRHD